MKKIMVIPLVVLSIVLTGCGGKGISAENAGELFVERLVYQKEEDQFAKAFRDGEALGKELDENREVFQENFIQGLSAAGAEIPEEQADRLTEELLKQAKEKTSYRIAGIEETKTGTTITYFVTGLDLVSAMQEMTRQIVAKALDNPEIAEDDQKTLEATFAILEERVQAIKIKNEPVELELSLGKEKGKWFVSDDQDEAIFNLFMAFISGTEDKETMDEELEEALNEVAKEIVDKLDKQPIPSKE